MFVQANTVQVGDAFDLTPLLHFFQDEGHYNPSEEDWDRATYEYARIIEIQTNENGCLDLYTTLGRWTVYPDTFIDLQGDSNVV